MAERQHQAAGVTGVRRLCVGPFFNVYRTFMSYDPYDIEEGFTGHFRFLLLSCPHKYLSRLSPSLLSIALIPHFFCDI